MPSVASNIPPQDKSAKSVKSILKSVKDRVASVVEGAWMHDGRQTTKTMGRVTKGVVQIMDPNGGLCLVTRELGSEAPLDHAHLFPRCENKNDDLITKLEYAFGIGYRLLNIDDAMNIILVKCDWHRHFDNKRWLLLPTIEMVNRLGQDHKPGEDITKVYGNATKFTYRLIPIGTGRLMSVLRYPRPDGTTHEDPESRPEPELFQYPYGNLPELESHAQPHWVILNAGMKLKGRSHPEMIAFRKRVAEAYGVPLTTAKQFINRIVKLDHDWRSTTPPEGFMTQKVDVAAADNAVPDVAAADNAAPDFAAADNAAPDVVAPDVAVPDVAALDVAVPDVAVPDVAVPDVAAPDDVDDPSSEDEDTGSIGIEKSSFGYRIISTAKSTFNIIRSPKRPMSSSYAASSLKTPTRERKRGRVGKKSRNA